MNNNIDIEQHMVDHHDNKMDQMNRLLLDYLQPESKPAVAMK
jgi:hypothetical protein